MKNKRLNNSSHQKQKQQKKKVYPFSSYINNVQLESGSCKPNSFIYLFLTLEAILEAYSVITH